jgi:prepilin-type N-terminal cleavage/methylation domain-containing protein/prepilin-type processing-associated H-X9-DG protein
MRRAGFTLIELLVVIAVIALLIGIALPAMAMVKERGRAIVCISNIKQQHLAMLLYENSNGSFPTGFDFRSTVASNLLSADEYIGVPIYDWVGKWWFQFLDFDGESENYPLWCPSSQVKDQGFNKLVLCGNYGVNRAICKDAIPEGGEFTGKPLSSTNISQPSATLFLVDSGYTLISWRGASDSGASYYEIATRANRFYIPGMNINQTRAISPYALDDAIKGRHSDKRINAAYIDGHAEIIPAESLFAEEQPNGTYINRETLWLPK